MSEERGIIFAVTDPDERTMTVGEAQATWLRDQGLLTEVQTGDPFVRMFRSEVAVGKLNHLVFQQLELRQCDYCQVLGAPWEIPCRPFVLKTGPAPGPLGGPERPMVACSSCVELVRDNRKRELIDTIIEQAIKDARRKGGHLRKIVQSHSHETMRRQIYPIAKEVVTATFANRQGYPRKAEVA